MKTCLSFVFCAIFVTCFLRGASSLNVTITASPSRAAKESRVFVRCSTEPREAISGCQFRLWYVGKQQEGAMFNVTRGDNKVEIPNPYSTGTSYTAQLFSSHFDKGVCDVTLEKVKGDHFVVGCKLTTKSHRSGVETTPIFFTDTLPLKLVKNETTLIVSAEESVNISLQTEGSVGLTNCNATLPNLVKLLVKRGTDSGHHNLVARYRYSAYHQDPEYTPYGGELAEGECGFIINKVMERHNGVFFVLAYGKDGKSVGAMAVTLVVKPKRPTIKMTFLEDKEDFDVGDNLTVTCTASGVPRPAVEWRWGWWNSTTNVEEPLTVHQQGDDIEGWSWPWQEAVFSQNVTFTLRKEHHGKMIRCSVGVLKKPDLIATQSKLITIQGMRPPATTPSTTTTQPPTQPPNKITTTSDSPAETDAFHRIAFYVILGVVGVITTAVAVAYAKRSQRCCFQGNRLSRGRMSNNEPFYDEIDGALALQLASPPSLPARPAARNALRNVQLAVPEEIAPKRPPSPDYIIPEPPDDSVDAAGYMRPTVKF